MCYPYKSSWKVLTRFIYPRTTNLLVKKTNMIKCVEKKLTISKLLKWRRPYLTEACTNTSMNTQSLTDLISLSKHNLNRNYDDLVRNLVMPPPWHDRSRHKMSLYESSICKINIPVINVSIYNAKAVSWVTLKGIKGTRNKYCIAIAFNRRTTTSRKQMP